MPAMSGAMGLWCPARLAFVTNQIFLPCVCCWRQTPHPPSAAGRHAPSDRIQITRKKQISHAQSARARTCTRKGPTPPHGCPPRRCGAYARWAPPGNQARTTWLPLKAALERQKATGELCFPAKNRDGCSQSVCPSTESFYRPLVLDETKGKVSIAFYMRRARGQGGF
jgi:hypothetical protein